MNRWKVLALASDNLYNNPLARTIDNYHSEHLALAMYSLTGKMQGDTIRSRVITMGIKKLKSKVEECSALIRTHYLSNQQYPWILGFSGGKDSTLLLQMTIDVIRNVSPNQRERKLHIVCNDTLVESPVYHEYVKDTLSRVKESLDEMKLNACVERTVPDFRDTFWFNILGKGYPAPNRTFRWCTDRLKIRPTSSYISSLVKTYQSAILLLGVRRSESVNRAKVLSRYDESLVNDMSAHNDIPGCMVFAPIKELSTSDVWTILEGSNPPWGGDHRALCTLYRDACAGDQAFIKPADTEVSSPSSRFGCWVCTVVKKDRSLEATIENGHPELKCLLEYREKIRKFSSDCPEYRSKTRRDGRYGLGPLTLEARRILLDDLLTISKNTGILFLSPSEIKAIREQWIVDEITTEIRELKVSFGGK